MSLTQIIKAHDGEVCFRGVNISSFDDLTSQIEDKEQYIENLRNRIKMMTIAQARDLFPGKDNLVLSVDIAVDDLMDDYEDNYGTLCMLYTIKSLIDDYVYKTGCTLEEAWKQAYVDMYADLKNEVEK